MPIKKPWAHLDSASDRASTWREIYGGLHVPIESPIPILAQSPVGITTFYKIDVARLDDAIVERAIRHIVEVFGIAEKEVRQGVFGKIGLPILAEDVTVTFDARMA